MKKSMFLSVLLLVLSIIVFAGSTIAYFSDTKQVGNTFTSGNVEISLSESAVKVDSVGNLVIDPQKPRIEGSSGETVHDYGVIHPGQSIFKDPLVKNIGTNDAWVAVKVTFTDGAGDLCQLLGYDPDETDMIDIECMLKGGLLDETVHVGNWNGFERVCYNDRYAMVQQASRANGEYVFYFFMLRPLSKNESFLVFDEMFIDGKFDNNAMQQLSELKINVCAYAVQTFGFDSCYKAMTTAFQSGFTL